MAQIRGVNLGGWFVLEKWMKPDLFEGISGPDETVFCKENPSAKDSLEHHWQTFITEEDFAYLRDLGINSVRLPIPWWAFIETKPYFNPIKYIDQAMDWAKQYNLSVLLDLHTTPGSQNGFDNGGITGVMEWHKSQENINLTVDVLEKIAIRYKEHEALWGLQVINEPHWTIDLQIIQDFYLEAYRVIRKHLSKHVIVFHDGFRPDDVSWKPFFTNHSFEEVAFDLHLYHCFDPKLQDTKIQEHIQLAFERGNTLISDVSQFTRVITGEWSLGIHDHVLSGMDEFNQTIALTLLGNAELSAYEKGFGWYFWSYKIDRDSHLGWDFKRLVSAGILPNNYR